MRWSYSDDARMGDHMWWISDTRRFQADFPDWRYRYDLDGILDQMHAAVERRLRDDAA